MKKLLVAFLALLASVGMAEDYSLVLDITYSNPFSYVRIGVTDNDQANPWSNGIYVGYGNEIGYAGVTSKKMGNDYWYGSSIPVLSLESYVEGGYNFYVELVGADSYSKLAYSDLVDFDTVASFIDLGSNTFAKWTLDQNSLHAVPEPTSGVLLLVGGALLCLRRKRRRA